MTPLQAEAVAEELDELPTPYRFDVKAYGSIADGPLREHIARVGVSLYRRDPPNRADAKAAKSAEHNGMGAEWEPIGEDLFETYRREQH